ncbi:hypothetical protein [Deinococcus arenicola]|uniref:HEAT repeat domain-containing protein n=1 Tax=Deinococcus arenicola TaxID=2994950 RepID=A0ABU4DVR5_9DEIO|nr:hypothetical protein [Deinococcus sp. ZS9-10]MDV6376539.1 hypothetical protein [Deinococcus sp. ZS9-10]
MTRQSADRCAQCGRIHPPDWQAGDLCSHCGGASREDARCVWCTRLTPPGAFCRSCGSEQLPAAWYGAARMLRALGVDQFSLPERLRAMPPAQREHFGRQYAPHQAVLERLLDDLAFAESFIDRRGWSAALEDQWLPLLPLAPETLAALSLPPSQADTDEERLGEMRDQARLPLSAHLASLARLRLGVRRNEADATNLAAALRSGDPALQEAVALALARWPFAYVHPYGPPGELRDALWTLYRVTGSPEAGLGLSLLARQYANVSSEVIPEELLAPLLGSEDPDLAFGAALALNQQSVLQAALRRPQLRLAAALGLARGGAGHLLAPVLTMLSDDELEHLLTYLGSESLAELRPGLLELTEGPHRPAVQRAALDLLARLGDPDDALRLITARPSWYATGVLANPDLKFQQLEAVLTALLGQGLDPQQVNGFMALATDGRVGSGFVPAVFNGVRPDAQLSLISFAGQQLKAGRDQGLHRWLWSLIEGDFPDQIQERAWAVLAGWYGTYGAALELSRASVEQFFGSVTVFTERLCAVAEAPQLTGRFFNSYRFLAVLSEVSEDALAPLSALGPLSERLWKALLALVQNTAVFLPDRAASLRLLGQLTRSETQRATLEAQCRPLVNDQDTPAALQQSALAVLYPSEAAQSVYLTELEAQLAQAHTYGERSPIESVIYSLRALMRT